MVVVVVLVVVVVVCIFVVICADEVHTVWLLVMQEFQKEKVEPVSKMYDETRRVGQALIQSAAAGVSTTDIEFNLRTLNNVWTTLTDRVLCPAYLLTYSVY